MVEEINIKENLENISNRINEAMKSRADDLKHINPTLVAVSKTKPLELILEAYDAGQRHFGENYPQELISKASDERVLQKCPEIKWHFIGHLQSNKASKIVSLPNLYVIETVDSEKLASLLEECVLKHNLSSKLKVFVQVNTSLEEDKNGVLPNDTVSLVKHIYEKCPHLTFSGLMTIGKFGYDLSEGPNPDFLTLIKCKKDVCQELELSSADVQLSMGMSDDFEHAIEVGSSNVRVGSSIFGFRERKGKPQTTN